MQEIINNCFGSKKRNTTLRQTKISKHKHRKITVTRQKRKTVTLVCKNIRAGNFALKGSYKLRNATEKHHKLPFCSMTDEHFAK